MTGNRSKLELLIQKIIWLSNKLQNLYINSVSETSDYILSAYNFFPPKYFTENIYNSQNLGVLLVFELKKS